jgi:hypothetical protein
MVNRFETPYNLISVTSSSDQFAVELVPVREGFEYEIIVTPDKSITEAVGAKVSVQTECPAELSESRTYTLTATVR